ncbi:MAG: hypothetical protein O3A36_03175 [bacterium]|nr:hypothetical protein [bacterium]
MKLLRQNKNLIWMRSLEQSILDTIRFFDLYDMPVTATQIWQNLVVANSHDEHHVLLREIQASIATSEFLREKIATKWGYSTLTGRQDLVVKKLRRHAISQDKWKIVQRCASFLACVPFVRALAGSGSLAVDNTKYSSDLDIFVVAQEGRIWTVRLFLLGVSALLGRRRTYGEAYAPDMLCINHYITNKSLLISPDIQNVCMAMQYASLIPIYNDSLIREFHQRNSGWMNRFLRTSPRPHNEHQYTVKIRSMFLFLKYQAEKLLLEPVGDMVEYLAEHLQRHVIMSHKSSRGRIVLSYHELAFHPDTKVPAIVKAFDNANLQNY